MANTADIKLSPFYKCALCAAAISFPIIASYIRRKRDEPEPYEFESFLRGKQAVSKGATSSSAVESFSFDAFLKNTSQNKTLDSTCFSDFLKSSSSAPAVQNSAPAAPVKAKFQPGPNAARVVVMYGTEYGFAKEISQALSKRLEESGKYWPVLVDMADCSSGYDFSSEQALLIVCSTQGDGVPPTEARDFCEWIFAGKSGKLDHLVYSVCALGDRAYTHFCRCGTMLDQSMQDLGAKCLTYRQEVDREDWPSINKWMDGVMSALAASKLKTLADLGVVPAAAATVASGQPPAKEGSRRWTKSRPYPARVIAIEKLCQVSSADDKNTVRLELDLGTSNLKYEPGDALGIYPRNRGQDVDELLELLVSDAMDLVPVPSWHYEEQDTHYPDNVMALSHALTKCYDIRSPRLAIFPLLLSCLTDDSLELAPTITTGTAAHSNGITSSNGGIANGDGSAADSNGNGLMTNGLAGGDKGKERAQLQVLCASDAKAQESFCEGRHVADILRCFPSASQHLTAAQLLPCLKPLLYRLYSISSSPLESAKRVQATIAEVKYLAHDSDRVGVCSTYVSARLKVGLLVPVFIHKNPDFRLPPSPATPIIMVGPGTGLAPFRSFIQQRLLSAPEAPPSGPMMLFFGCRRRDQDYLYGSQLEGWAAEGKLTLVTAFSRETSRKVYVQQRMAEQGDKVWELLQQGGHFYICGDALHMAGEVESALVKIIMTKQQCDESAAQAYISELARTNRFQRDVWY